jgi:hypothetical protein
MGARYCMYKQAYIQLTTFLPVLLLDPWAGQLAPDFHVRNSNHELISPGHPN